MKLNTTFLESYPKFLKLNSVLKHIQFEWMEKKQSENRKAGNFVERELQLLKKN